MDFILTGGPIPCTRATAVGSHTPTSELLIIQTIHQSPFDNGKQSFVNGESSFFNAESSFSRQRT